MNSGYNKQRPPAGYSGLTGSIYIPAQIRTPQKSKRGRHLLGVLAGIGIVAAFAAASLQICSRHTAHAPAPDHAKIADVVHTDKIDAQALADKIASLDTSKTTAQVTTASPQSNEERVNAFYQSFPAFRPETAKWLQKLMGSLNIKSSHAPIIAGVEGLWKNQKCEIKGQSAFGLFQYTKGSFPSYVGELKSSGDEEYIKRACALTPQFRTLLNDVEINKNGQWAPKKGREENVNRARQNQTVNVIVGLFTLEKHAKAIEATGLAPSHEKIWFCHILGRARALKVLQAALRNPNVSLAEIKDKDGKPLVSKNVIKLNKVLSAKNIPELLENMRQKIDVAGSWSLAMNTAQAVLPKRGRQFTSLKPRAQHNIG